MTTSFVYVKMKKNMLEKYFKNPFEHQLQAPAFKKPTAIKADSYFEFTKKEKLPQEITKETLNELLDSKNIEEIITLINNDKLENLSFFKETERIKTEYAEYFSDATFLTPQDWKILTVIELFDKKILEHSIGTYQLAKEKIEHSLIEIGYDIKQEGVKFEQLYRACLMHDIGKLVIPKFILNNKTTDEEWTKYFMELSEEQKSEILSAQKIIVSTEIKNDPKKMTNFFSRNRIRAVKFVPITSLSDKFLNEEEKEYLRENGIDPNQSLGEIMQIHEKKSEEILKSFGFETEALLAGNHHNYRYKDKSLGEKPVSLSTMHISIEIASNIIHLADIQQALSHDRSYHQKQPSLRIMAYLVDDAKKNIVDSRVTALWINDELKKMNPAYLKEILSMKALYQHHSYLIARNLELKSITEFLIDNLPAEKLSLAA